jgi:hypothetical protein
MVSVKFRVKARGSIRLGMQLGLLFVLGIGLVLELLLW